MMNYGRMTLLGIARKDGEGVTLLVRVELEAAKFEGLRPVLPNANHQPPLVVEYAIDVESFEKFAGSCIAALEVLSVVEALDSGRKDN